MELTLLALAALACPVGMGLMMWLMMRGRRTSPGEDKAAQVEQLRAEIDHLKADRAVRVEDAR